MKISKFVFLFTILLFSCQTEEFESSNFEDSSILKRNDYQNSILLSKVITAFNDYDSDYKFTQNYIDKYGQVEWENYLFYSDNEIENGIVYFPIKKSDDNEVQGMLVGISLPSSSGINLDIIGKDEVILSIDKPGENPRINLHNEVKIFNIFDSALYGKGENELIDSPTNVESVDVATSCDDCIIKPIIQNTDDNGDDNGDNTSNDGNDNNNSSSEGNGDVDDTGPDRGNDTNNDNGGNNSGGGNTTDTGNSWSSNYAGSGWGWSGTGIGGIGNTSSSNNTGDSNTANNTGGGDEENTEYPPLPDEGEDDDIIILTRGAGDVYVTIDCAEGNYSGTEPEITHANAENAINMAQSVGLDCDEMDCLFKNSDVLNKMEELLSSYNFPCDEGTTASIVQDLISEVCENHKSVDRIDKLLDKLEKTDLIHIEESFSNCKKVKCVYDLLDSQNNGLFCSTFGEIFDSDDIHLHLKTGNRFSEVSGGEGVTSYNDNNITITIADDLCNGNEHPLQIAGTLLHEAIHASMYQNAITQNPDLEADDYCSVWQSHFQTNDPCHEIMANQYVNLLAQAISNLDNNRFALDHYLYIAWNGLESIGSDLGLIADEYNSEYFDEYQTLIKSPFDFCND